MAGVITVTLQTITDVRHCVKVKETARVEDLKTELYKSSGIRSKVKLLLNKEELDDKKQLIEYQIAHGEVIQMLVVPPVDIKLIVHIFKKGKVTLKASNNNTPNDVRDFINEIKNTIWEFHRKFTTCTITLINWNMISLCISKVLQTILTFMWNAVMPPSRLVSWMRFHLR